METSVKQKKYTYADYCSWSDGERWELIEGIPYAMSPAPSRLHQEISVGLTLMIGNFLKGSPCKLFHAPFDVRLDDYTVVQPDLSIVYDASKLDDRGCKGAPDLIIEILSPSTARHDRITKFHQYQKADVKEYWIVDPDTKSVQIHTLSANGIYGIVIYAEAEVAPSGILEGCKINLQELFAMEDAKWEQS